MRLAMIALLGLFGVSTAALAQAPAPQATRLAPAATRVNPNVVVDQQAVTQGQITQLRAQVKGLQSQVKTLQSQVTDLGAKTVTYQCTGLATGQNSKGVTFDCSPYVCDRAFAQCKTVCVTRADCESGYYCDQPNRLCIAER